MKPTTLEILAVLFFALLVVIVPPIIDATVDTCMMQGVPLSP